ncbi:ATP-binding protein [Candidatus Nitrospira bockiana]
MTPSSGNPILPISEQRYRHLMELSRDIIVSLSSDLTVLSLNPAFEVLTGWPVADWTGRSFLSLVHPEEHGGIADLLRQAADGERPPLFEARLRTKSDDWLFVEISLAGERDADHGTTILGIARDITQRKRAEETLIQREAQLQQAQKMEAIGRLAGGIAHDFNNLLTIITGYSQLLLSRLRHDDQLRADVEEIRKAAVRAASLTQQLLAFSRRQVLMPKVLNLNCIVETIDTMLQRLIGEDIHLVAALDPRLGHVKADPAQMEQVIMNLAVNARDAMPKGGKLTIETANVEVLETVDQGEARIPPGRYARLIVSDTGCGMDPATQGRIFEPFFTTKGQGKGTGLGLSTVYGIVKQSDGHIVVDSQVGAGTTFTIYLPLVEDPVIEPPDNERLPPTLPYGTETVLLVEDEPTVRVLIRDTLRLFGYTVLEARHGFEAQLIGSQQASRIDLLMTDVVMPQMDGRELAEGLMKLHPDMKVLYMSGYTETAMVDHGVLSTGSAFLQKPFTPETLARKVRETLDAVKA